MASIKYLFTISFLIIIAFNFVLTAPVSSQEAAAARKNDDSEESPENDKQIPAKVNASDTALEEQDTNESSDEASGQKPQKPEHAHKHRDHSDHLDVEDDDDSKLKKVEQNDDTVKSEKSDKVSDKSQKSDEKATALEADKPAAASHSEEEVEPEIKKPLADNTYPKAPAATAAEDRQQQSREMVDKDSKSVVSSDSDANEKNEEVPVPAKGTGTMTQEENEGVANLTEDKQMDDRQDGITVVGTTMKSPNSGITTSVSFSLILLSILFYIFQ